MAFLAAPAAKILVAILIAGGIFGSGYYLGFTRCANSTKAAIMEQALDANENMRKANEHNAMIVRELAVTMERLVKKENEAIGIKEGYANSNEEKFVLGHQLELAVNALSQLYNATPDRVSTSSDVTRGAAEFGEAVPSSTALLAAYGHCTEELTRVLDAYYYPLVRAYRSERVLALEGAGYQK